MTRPIYAIAGDIQADWAKVNFAAAPYLDAMTTLNTINDDYLASNARWMVARFLSNASAWRGPTARQIKAELNSMLKGAA